MKNECSKKGLTSARTSQKLIKRQTETTWFGAINTRSTFIFIEHRCTKIAEHAKNCRQCSSFMKTVTASNYKIVSGSWTDDQHRARAKRKWSGAPIPSIQDQGRDTSRQFTTQRGKYTWHFKGNLESNDFTTWSKRFVEFITQ